MNETTMLLTELEGIIDTLRYLTDTIRAIGLCYNADNPLPPIGDPFSAPVEQLEEKAERATEIKDRLFALHGRTPNE